MQKSGSPASVYIGLGSNLAHGKIQSNTLLRCAIGELEVGGDKIVATSSLWVSDAWPKQTNAPKFINAVCQVQPFCSDPARLLKRLHTIEAEFGRNRDELYQWAERTLDLDLLDYNGLISRNNSFPTLPHPRIAVRDFVLRPLLEVSANWVHPITRKSGQELLFELEKNGNTNNCVLFQGRGFEE